MHTFVIPDRASSGSCLFICASLWQGHPGRTKVIIRERAREEREMCFCSVELQIKGSLWSFSAAQGGGGGVNMARDEGPLWVLEQGKQGL